MLKCNFNKVAKHLYWNHTSTWVFSCKFAAYFQNTFSYQRLWRVASLSSETWLQRRWNPVLLHQVVGCICVNVTGGLVEKCHKVNWPSRHFHILFWESADIFIIHSSTELLNSFVQKAISCYCKKMLTIIAKIFIIDVWQLPKYVSGWIPNWIHFKSEIHVFLWFQEQQNGK